MKFRYALDQPDLGRSLLLVIASAVTALVHAATPTGPNVTTATAPAPPYRAPFVPTADGEVLQQVPPASDPMVRRMEVLRVKRNALPNDLRTAEQLARAYIDFGRQLGDAHYAGYAEAVMAPFLAKDPGLYSALVLQATILQYRHLFGEARALLKKALQSEPRNAQAWLALATLDMVQGDYASANADCAQVASQGGLIPGMVCLSNLRSYQGHAQQSIAMLKQVEGDAPALSAPMNAWVQGMLAESEERLGNWAEAEAHHKKALTYAPSDNFLLVAYADFLLDRNRPNEVLNLLGDYSQSDTAFLRLALAQAALGSPELPRYTWIMGARFEALTQRGSDYYGREQARFALHLQRDPQRALDLAQRNWQMQREPWDARVLLEAAQAAKEPQAAAPVLAFLEQSKLQDPIIEALARQLRLQLKIATTPAP